MPKSYGATFTADMVLAILRDNDPKSMARRVIEKIDHFKRIKPGDTLYVKECWGVYKEVDEDHIKATYVAPASLRYKADGKHQPVGRWRSGMLMPQWVARIRRTVVSTRVERVQEITEEDAKKEGVEFLHPDSEVFYRDYQLRTLNGCETARESFISLWSSINAKRGYGWQNNPKVRVIEWRNDES